MKSKILIIIFCSLSLSYIFLQAIESDFLKKQADIIVAEKLKQSEIEPYGKEIDVLGINWGDYGYLNIYESVIFPKDLLLSGIVTDTDGQVQFQLSLIDRQDKKLQSKMIENDPILNPVKFNHTFCVSYPYKKKDKKFIVFAYLRDSSGMKMARWERIVDIYEMKDRHLNFLVKADHGVVLESAIADHQPPIYVAEEEWNDKPAYRNSSKVMIGDVNDDGFEDILLWIKVDQARKLRPQEDIFDARLSKDKFIFDREELYVMYFDPQTNGFLPLEPFDK